MHPFFDTKQKLGILLLVWSMLTFGVSTLLGTLYSYSVADSLLLFGPLYFFCLVLILPNYYVCRGLPLSDTRPVYLATSHVLTLGMAVLFWYLLGRFYAGILDRVTGMGEWSAFYETTLYTNLGIVAVQFEIIVLLHYLLFALHRTNQLEQAALKQKLLISQAELQTLKATVHPHFLFNSLNTLSNIALSTPEKAHRFCLLLAEFLRYSVAYSKKSEATLADEIEHVQNYLGIERERFGDRLESTFEIDDELLRVQVPPLVLFPIVENAIKHGIDSRIEGGNINLKVRRNGNTLVIMVENPVDELGRKHKGTGHGLASVEQRLKNRYGENARLKKVSAPGKFVVSLYMPLGFEQSGEEP